MKPTTKTVWKVIAALTRLVLIADKALQIMTMISAGKKMVHRRRP
jgi:hypothetical protein